MRVLLVGPYRQDGQQSIPAFVSALQKGLSALDIDVSVTGPEPTRMGAALKSVIGRRYAFYDKFVAYPRHLRRQAKSADIVHIAEHGYAPYVKHLRSAKTVVTCHDLIVAKAAVGEIPNWPLSGPAIQYQKSILQGLHDADHVIGISQATVDDTIRLANRTSANTSLIYHDLFREFQRLDDAKALQLVAGLGVVEEGKPFLFHIGGNQPNKNRAGTIRIIREIQETEKLPNLTLIMAGPKPTEEMLAEKARAKNPAAIKFIENPTDDQVIALYSLATALLFPSLYEGFGLPIVEGMSIKCPVITSQNKPMSEVGGNAALYIDPTDEKQAAAIITENFNNLHNLIQPGITNANRFTNGEMSRKHADLYREILA